MLRIRAMQEWEFQWRQNRLKVCLCVCASMLLSVLLTLRPLPIAAVLFSYLIIWHGVWFWGYGNKKAIFIYTLLEFLCFSSFFLLLLGVTSIGHSDVNLIYVNDKMRVGIYAGAKIAACIYYVVCHYFLSSNSVQEYMDRSKLKIFVNFLRICVVCVLFDSILASLFSDALFVPVLLISGNILASLLAFMFLRNEYLLVRHQHLEETLRKMEEERARNEIEKNKIAQIAQRDSMTGAYARRYGLEQFEKIIASEIPIVIAYLDLDGLKDINDTRGHGVGDQYLKEFVVYLTSFLGEYDSLIRMGGDEFLILFPHAQEQEVAEKMKRMRAEMEKGKETKERFFFSYGIYAGGGSAQKQIEAADMLMYQDKKRRKGVSRYEI